MTELERWPALVLTAGLATRLRPLSLVRAKAAMPVAGEILVRRILRWLHASGIRRVVLNLHHLPETITGCVGDGRDLGLEVRYSWENVLLGSAGGPRRAIPIVDAEQFFIVNGDTLTDVDLVALSSAHQTSGALVTMAVVEGDIERYGGVCVGPAGDVRRFARRTATSSEASRVSEQSAVVSHLSAGQRRAEGERPRVQERVLHFIGVQAVQARVFANLADDRASETVASVYPQLMARQAGSVRAHESRARFLDIGTTRDYLTTVIGVARDEGRALDVGTGVRVDPTAQVRDSILWDNVSVAAGARIVECVVADGVAVPEGARYERQVLVQVNNEVQATSF